MAFGFKLPVVDGKTNLFCVKVYRFIGTLDGDNDLQFNTHVPLFVFIRRLPEYYRGATFARLVFWNNKRIVYVSFLLRRDVKSYSYKNIVIQEILLLWARDICHHGPHKCQALWAFAPATNKLLPVNHENKSRKNSFEPSGPVMDKVALVDSTRTQKQKKSQHRRSVLIKSARMSIVISLVSKAYSIPFSNSRWRIMSAFRLAIRVCFLF